MVVFPWKYLLKYLMHMSCCYLITLILYMALATCTLVNLRFAQLSYLKFGPGQKTVIFELLCSTFQEMKTATMCHIRKTNLKWMQNQKNFWRNLSKFHFQTRVDLFASRLNTQLSVYDSYNPDPEAMHINWFFISWLNRLFYAFPRFSVIGRALHEIVLDEAAWIIILPNWSAQPWYSLLMKLLNNTPILSPASKIFPQHLEKKEQHNLAGKSALQACLILGKNRSNKPFSREYQNHTGEYAF